MFEIENNNKIIFAFSIAAILHLALVFSLNDVNKHFQITKSELTQPIKVNLTSFIERSKKPTIGPSENDTSQTNPEPTSQANSPIPKITATDTSQSTQFSYSDIKKWVENDTHDSKENHSQAVTDFNNSFESSNSVQIFGGNNREQIVLQNKVITTYENGEVDVKVNIFGKDHCYKFDNSHDSFGVVIPYKCRKRRDTLKLNRY